MKALRLVLLLFVLSCASLTAQTDSVYTGSAGPRNKKPRDDAWKKKFTYGGNFQAWIGNPTFVFLSPNIGYIPFENFNVGIGGIYNYTSRDYGPYGKYSQSIFGGHSYVRYIIAESYFVQLQYDKLYQPDVFAASPDAKRWVDYLLVGGGFRQAVGDRAAITSSIMYNLTPNDLSIYPSRVIIQFGFIGGF
jgi:hypothetical protein